MEFLTLEKFQRLIQHQARLSLSIYLPTIKAGSEIKQNEVRFKNLVSEADKRLEESGMSYLDREEFLKPANDLIERREFWKKQEAGLAVFLTEDFFEILRLPLEVKKIVTLGERFHIKPLLPLFVENERFFLLALSRKQVRFFAGTRFNLTQITLPDTPASLDEALRFDDPERELQYQAGATGGDGAVYHGHHPEGDQNDNIRRFFQKVDQGVMDAVGEESAPLIIAGLDYLHPLYRDANSYGELLGDGVYQNPDQAVLEQIHHEAWEIMEKRIEKSQAELLDLYHASANQKTSEKLDEILPAAVNARIDTLLVDLSSEKWGKYDREQDLVQRISPGSPESIDLVDHAVVHTLLNGGSVRAIPPANNNQNSIPEMAAIFRY